jgi:hypothetical protein
MQRGNLITDHLLKVMRATFSASSTSAAATAAPGLVDAAGREVDPQTWAPLFEPTDFFVRFDNYLVLDISAANEQVQPLYHTLRWLQT